MVKVRAYAARERPFERPTTLSITIMGYQRRRKAAVQIHSIRHCFLGSLEVRVMECRPKVCKCRIQNLYFIIIEKLQDVWYEVMFAGQCEYSFNVLPQ